MRTSLTLRKYALFMSVARGPRAGRLRVCEYETDVLSLLVVILCAYLYAQLQDSLSCAV